MCKDDEAKARLMRLFEDDKEHMVLEMSRSRLVMDCTIGMFRDAAAEGLLIQAFIVQQLLRGSVALTCTP